MKLIALIFPLIVTLVTDCAARGVVFLPTEELIATSEIVMVGKVKSVGPSGITTRLGQPFWENTVFEWLKVEVEVIESLKGTEKGTVVETYMLSTRGDRPPNGPGVVDPKVGQYHLLFLRPTTSKGIYASATAPIDDNSAVMILDRTNRTYSAYKENPTVYGDGSSYGEFCRLIWNLVDDKGQIIPHGADEFRRKYKVEFATVPPKDAVVYLKWKTKTSDSGWKFDVPVEQETEAEKAGFDPWDPTAGDMPHVNTQPQPTKAEQPGAAQPATQPADKGPAEVQPPTPTSEDGTR